MGSDADARMYARRSDPKSLRVRILRILQQNSLAQHWARYLELPLGCLFSFFLLLRITSELIFFGLQQIKRREAQIKSPPMGKIQGGSCAGGPEGSFALARPQAPGPLWVRSLHTVE